MSERDIRTARVEREALRIMRRALDEPVERRAEFVRIECNGDDVVAARVGALLTALDDAEGFMAEPAVRHAPGGVASEVEQPPDSRVGHYRILRQIGAGGMGVVYLAEQDNPRRMVALKMLRSGLASARARRRFEHESQILGRLDHPNVARVYEASTSVDERLGTSIPFFAMEHIAGAIALTTYARDHHLDLAERIALFRKACHGVHHGHQKGIVHRDLKPANIVVDAAGEPRVIDYGVAVATTSEHGTTFAHSDGGHLVGTLKYMSPEQCLGEAGRVDTRSDVHALGIVLYELLCDRFPHDFDGLSPIDITRVIMERPPLRPRLASPTLPADLETIILKAMAKAPDDRYQSVADLQRDLGRFLRHEPIEARPFSAAYHARLFARRHRTLIAAGTFTAVAALAATFASIAFAVAARNAERQAMVERDRALGRQYLADMAAAESALRSNEFRRLRTHLDRAPEALRGWEWTYMHEQSDPSLVVLEHPVIVDTVATLADGDHFLVGGRDGQVQMRTLEDGRLVRTGRAETNAILGMAVAPDGRSVAVTTESGRIELLGLPAFDRLWQSQRRHGDLGRNGDARALTYAPDGRSVMSVGRDGTVRSWNAHDGSEQWLGELPESRRGGEIIAIAHHPSLPLLATAGDDGIIDLWDAATGMPLRRFEGHPKSYVVTLIFTHDGDTLLSGANDRTIGVWSLSTGRRIRTLLGHDRSVWCLAISPDGATLASASIDHTVRTWSLADGTPLDVFHGHGDAVANVAFNDDGSRLVSASWDRTTRVWDTARAEGTIEPRRPREPVDAIEFSPDGRLFATAYASEPGESEAPVILRDAITLDAIGEIARDGTRSRSLHFDPDGTRLAVAWMDGTVTLHDTSTGAAKTFLEPEHGPALTVRFTPDGTRVVTGHRDDLVRLWSSESGSRVGAIECATRNIARLEISADGRRLLTASSGGIAQLFDLQSMTEVARLEGHLEAIFAIAISPDSRFAFTGSRDQSIRAWRCVDGTAVEELAGHGQWITGLAFTPDGSRLVSASRFETITLWDTDLLEPIVTLRGHDRPLRAITVDPHGDRLATADDMGTIRFWDRRSRSTRRGLTQRARSIADEIGRMLDDRLMDGAPSAVADAIASDPEFDALARHVALNALLRRGLAATGTGTQVTSPSIAAAITGEPSAGD